MNILLINKHNFYQVQINNVTVISFANNAYVINGQSYSKDDYNITILW